MITFLLIVIAVLLFVLASKIAPEELNSLWVVCMVGAGIYLIFEYWQYIIAVPILAVYGFKSFEQTEAFTWFAYIFDALLVGYFLYYFGKAVNKDLRNKEKRKEIVTETKSIMWLVGKIFLYSILGICALIAVGLILIYFTQAKG